MQDTTYLSELVTVRDYWRFAVTRFGDAGLAFGHGTTAATDDAAFLILETLRLPHDSLEPWLDARLTRAERIKVHDTIENRVVTRKPSSYITNSAYIGPHRFYVDPRVIVPRSFIGELLCADNVLPFGLAAPPARVLDLCTGSGCLAIVAAHAFPAAKVTAADLSADALAVATENVKRHGLAGRLELVQSDLFANLGDAKFDLIVCNPPYVTAAAVAAFPPEHKAEPALAHLGGIDGMDLVRKIMTSAGRHLSRDGLLVMEIGQGRATVEGDYPALPFLWLETEHSDGEVFALAATALQTGPKQTVTKQSAKKPKAGPAKSASRA